MVPYGGFWLMAKAQQEAIAQNCTLMALRCTQRDVKGGNCERYKSWAFEENANVCDRTSTPEEYKALNKDATFEDGYINEGYWMTKCLPKK